MKRTPLKRTKPLSKGAMKSWNSTLSKQSKDTAKDDRKLNPIRKAWRLLFKRCHICNRARPDHVHEIFGGSEWRHITKFLCCFWLAVCWRCHRIIQSDSVNWPPARQLAHKKVHDPVGFDLLEVNRTTEGVEVPIEMSEVDYWHERMPESEL